MRQQPTLSKFFYGCDSLLPTRSFFEENQSISLQVSRGLVRRDCNLPYRHCPEVVPRRTTQTMLWRIRAESISFDRRQQAHGDATPLARRNVIQVSAHLSFDSPCVCTSCYQQALVLLAKQEGRAGMFKGLSLNLVKVPHIICHDHDHILSRFMVGQPPLPQNPMGTAVSFVVNDHLKDVLGRMKQV